MNLVRWKHYVTMFDIGYLGLGDVDIIF